MAVTQTRFTPVFWKIHDAAVARPRPRYIHSEGGARSSKTFSALQLLDILVSNDRPGDVTSVCSESLPHLKRGCIRDFENILGHPLKADPGWNASDCVLTYPKGGKLEFFGVESYERVLGPSRKRLFLNEANHIPWETARQLFTRTSGLIICDNNPESSSWLDQRLDRRDNCVRIHSTYKDNPFLPDAIREEIEANREDENWWRVYGLGEMGRREGLIYPAFEIIDAMPDAAGMDECYGLDFGFAVSYTAGVRVLLDRVLKIAYIDELFYDRGMLRDDLDAALASAGVPRFSASPIYCDCARPDTIAELVALGWNATACDKSVSVEEQIGKIQGWKIRVTARSVAGIKELRSYSWKTDKSGNQLGVPVKVWDHFCDAFRYAIHSHTHGGESDIHFEGDAFRREDPEYYDYNEDEYDNDY